jgi:hypothetical protein
MTRLIRLLVLKTLGIIFKVHLDQNLELVMRSCDLKESPPKH